MNINDIILKKRNGGKLTKEEIEYYISGYTKGDIPDYQISALLMAIYFQKMDEDETFWLTEAMKHSGDIMDLSRIKGTKVDKHSTGGVGDKLTLVLAPLVSSCGVPIAKMSGRGLGFTGGTIDKLEAIPGFRTSLEMGEFFDQVNDIGISVIGQTAHVAPADKKIYALRDVTGTVDNLSLISSSIMSKKLASGSDAILLDVKCGRGAFMEDLESARELGNTMCKIGRMAGKNTVAVITDMSQPLGNAVGNGLEVMEAIDTLKGKGPEDIYELSVSLAGIMIYLGGGAKTSEEGREMAERSVKNGSALKKLKQFIEAQGGNSDVVEDYDIFGKANISENVFAEEDGYVEEIDARVVGLASQHCGAGREKKEDDIDLSAGILVRKKVGDKVTRGECIATVYGNDGEKVSRACKSVLKAYTIGAEQPPKPVLIKEILGLEY